MHYEKAHRLLQIAVILFQGPGQPKANSPCRSGCRRMPRENNYLRRYCRGLLQMPVPASELAPHVGQRLAQPIKIGFNVNVRAFSPPS
jgi:hypothetical protein